MIYLYIKIHNVTGLKYFGRTVKSDPHKYQGSGKYWKRHIAKYGYDVTTIIIGTYEKQEECEKDAIEFSIKNNIVESAEWANLIMETGKNGAPPSHTKDTKEKISKTSTKMWEDAEFRKMMIQKSKDSWTDERKEENSKLMKTLWTDERKKSHSHILSGRKTGPSPLRGIPKSVEHNRKNSEALKGRVKSEEHRKNLSIAKKGILTGTRKYNKVYDHFGNIFDNPRAFGIHYGLSGVDFFNYLKRPIRHKSVYDKLGIPYTDENRRKPRTELGIGFYEPPI